MTLDKATLLGAVLPTDTVELPDPHGEPPGSGGTVNVRGLSRAEVVALQALPTRDALENATVAAGMVEPALTVEEATAWRAVADNETVRVVSDRILELSGLVEGAQTEKERRFRAGDD